MRVMVALYCSSYDKPPASVTLDIGDTLDVVHGQQQSSMFNAHYDERCFLPIHIYDTATSRPVAVLLRPRQDPVRAGDTLATVMHATAQGRRSHHGDRLACARRFCRCLPETGLFRSITRSLQPTLNTGSVPSQQPDLTSAIFNAWTPQTRPSRANA